MHVLQHRHPEMTTGHPRHPTSVSAFAVITGGRPPCTCCNTVTLK